MGSHGWTVVLALGLLVWQALAEIPALDASNNHLGDGRGAGTLVMCCRLQGDGKNSPLPMAPIGGGNGQTCRQPVYARVAGSAGSHDAACRLHGPCVRTVFFFFFFFFFVSKPITT